MNNLSTGIRSEPGASDGGGVSVPDRTAAFRRARRHSLLVKTLKLIFPIGALGLLATFGLLVTANNVVPVRKGDKFDLGSFRPTKDGLAMINPRYEGFNKDGSKFLVTAKRAIPDFKQPDRVTLHEIDGTLTQPDGLRTRLVATRGLYDNKTGQLDLFERIDIVSESGMKAQLNSAKVYIKQNKIVSSTPVAAQMTTGTIRANAMVLHTKTRKAIFTKGVAVRLKPKPPSAGKTGKSTTGGLIGNADAPIDILSRQLHVHDITKIAVFTRGVRATQGDAALTAQKLIVYYEGKAAPAATDSGPPAGQQNGADSNGATLKRIKALGQVVMLAANGRRATSDSAVFDAAADTAVLAGNVVLTQGANVVKGGHLTLDRKADTALLTGNVRLRQGRNRLNGGRLFVDRKRGKSRLDRPAAGGGRAGRIDATFYQNKAGKGASRKGRKTRSRKPAPTKARAAPMQFKTNSDAPIKIIANRLDVDDKAKSAVFKGDVIARQDNMTIRTVALIATYAGSSGLGLDDGGAADAGAKQPARLTRVEARQKVLISTGDDQSASGDWADFDLDANTAVIGGNVVLKRGSAVILGERLYVDMTTGKTRIIPKRGGAKAVAASRKSKSLGPGGRPCPPGRTCLRLIPGQFEQQGKPRTGSAPSRRKGGWGASTSGSGSGKSRSNGNSQWQPSTSASSVIRAQ